MNDPHRDIERKLVRDPENPLVYERDGRIAGAAMVGYDGHRGWVNYMAVDPDARGAGIGRRRPFASRTRLRPRGERPSQFPHTSSRDV